MMNASNCFVGQQLAFKLKGNVVTGVYHSDYRGSAAITYGGKNYLRNYDKLLGPVASTASATVTVTEAPVAEAAPAPTYYDVNTRFTFIERLVDMIVREQERSLVVTGSGGLGKSFTVFNRLKLNDLGEADYVKISGHMTPKALYRTLHEQNGKLAIFDDCDSVLGNETSMNLLKSALDSYGNRQVNWCSEMGTERDLPSSFEFTGRVIYISNWPLVKVPQPLLSRALYVDVTMTADEKIERIRQIAPALCPDMSVVERNECIELLARLRHQIADLNLRTMLKISSIRRANPNWIDLATYACVADSRRQ